MNSSDYREATATSVRSDERVQGRFLVRRKVRGVGKTGKPWLQIILGDQTGTIDARVWDNADACDREVDENDVVDVQGQGVLFMDQVQLKVFRIQPVTDPDVDPADYLPSGSMSPEELLIQYRQAFERIKDPDIRRLVDAYLGDTDWWARFSRAPAAKSVHHAFIGGLCEHTLSMLRLAYSIGDHYVGMGVAPLNLDLLAAGVLLHDSGKIDELSQDGGFDYTDEGRLIGHITLGLQALDRKIAGLDGFPDDLAMHLRHLVLSHHGEYEFGSPRRPKTLEALILHFVDNLDSRVDIFAGAIRNASGSEGNWTGYESSVSRFIWRGRGPDTDD